MNTKSLLLTIISLCCLPIIGFTQGTYLNDPNDANNHALIIAPGGNVGIGTTNQAARLTIQDELSADAPQLRLLGNQSKPVAILGDGTGSIDPHGMLMLYNNTNVGVFLHGANNVNSYFNAGNLGIGTTQPQAKIHIDATDGSHFLLSQAGHASWGGGAYSDNTFRINEAGISARLVVASGGNVGIGTTTPQAKLDVTGNIRIVGNQISPFSPLTIEEGPGNNAIRIMSEEFGRQAFFRLAGGGPVIPDGGAAPRIKGVLS